MVLDLTVSKPYDFAAKPTLKRVPTGHYPSRGIEPRYMAPPPERDSPNWLPSIGAHGRIDLGILGSAAEVGSSIKAVIDIASRDAPEPVEGYDVKADPQFHDTEFERDYWESFIESESPEETTQIIGRIGRERQALQTIGDAGWPGTMALLGTLIASPESLIPIGGIAKLPATIGRLGRLATRAAEGAALTAGAAGIQSSALALDQETMTAENALWDAAIGGVIGGFLGPLAGRTVGGRDARQLANDLHRDMGVGSDALPDGARFGGPSSVGAAASETGSVELEHAFRVDRITSFATPAGRLFSSTNAWVRRTAAGLIDVGRTTEGGEGVTPALGGSVESQVKVLRGLQGQVQTETYRLYSLYRFGRDVAAPAARAGIAAMFGNRGKLSFYEFRQRVAWASIHGDADDIPEVAEAARFRREKFVNVLRDERMAVDENFAKAVQEMEARGVDNGYLHRMWDQAFVARHQDQLRAILTRHFMARQDEFIQRADDTARTAGVPEAELVPPEVMSRAEVETLAKEVVDTIMGMSPGRMTVPGEFIQAGARGAAKERMLRDLPTEDVWDFLVKDIDRIDAGYLRSVGVDTKLLKRFGSLDLAEPKRKIRDEATAEKQGKTGEQQAKIDKRAKDAIGDLDALVSIIRGTYKLPADPQGLAHRISSGLKTWNLLTSLGMMTVSAVPDLAKTVFTHGLTRTFRHGFVPMVTQFSQFRMTMKEVRQLGGGADMISGGRLLDLADLADNSLYATKFERSMQAGARSFAFATLMAPWNAALKQFAGAVTIRRTLEAARDWRAARITKKEMGFLADGGIDEAMAFRIADQFEKHGVIEGNVWSANTSAWGDARTRDAFGAHLVRNVDQIIVTPGAGDRPLMAHGDLGSIIFQFQSFAFASIEKTLLAGLRQRDAAVLNGVMMMLAFGALSYYVKAKLAGQKPEDQPLGVWAAEAIDNSGLLGVLSNANHLIEKLTADRLGLAALTGQPARRYINVNVAGALLGPSLGKGEDLATIVRSISTGNWTASTTRRARRLIPLQNLFYIRLLLNQVEQGTNQAFGIPMRAGERAAGARVRP